MTRKTYLSSCLGGGARCEGAPTATCVGGLLRRIATPADADLVVEMDPCGPGNADGLAGTAEVPTGLRRTGEVMLSLPRVDEVEGDSDGGRVVDERPVVSWTSVEGPVVHS
jgi:hypothetical protein